MNYQSILIVLFSTVLTLANSYANSLNLSTGTSTLSDNNQLKLDNIAVGEQFYKATIQLNLDGSFQVIDAQLQGQLDNAIYQISFTSFWNEQTHPDNFPLGSAHFSGLVGATHSNGSYLWQIGQPASPGIESMAETGSKSNLTNEVNNLIRQNQADKVLSGNGLATSPDSVTLEFEVNQKFPFVSLVSMLAPSPDWFVGVSNISLIKEGQWQNQLTIPLFVYDAGTDDGTTYQSSDIDSTPRQPIQRIINSPFKLGDETRTVGTFIFTRIQ